MVTTRKSILTILSTMGIRKINPGPFAPSSLPRRKMTPRSYSRKMRSACGSTMTAKMMITTSHGPKKRKMGMMISFIIFLRYVFLGFTFNVSPSIPTTSTG